MKTAWVRGDTRGRWWVTVDSTQFQSESTLPERLQSPRLDTVVSVWYSDMWFTVPTQRGQVGLRRGRWCYTNPAITLV